MKIKSLIIVDEETGKEYAFTHRSIVPVEEYKSEKDPEVQGIGLANLTSTNSTEASFTTSDTKVVKKLKAKKSKK